MRAIELQRFNSGLVLVDRPAPIARRGQEIIDVTACGVCHSDIHVVDGQFGSRLPLVPGHEVTGFHHQLGPVMMYAPWGCRHCWICETGHEMICPDGAEAGLFKDGGYAEQMVVPHRDYLYPLGDLDPVKSAPLACGGLTAFQGTNKTLETLRRRGSAARALVIGAGGLGQFGVQFLRMLSDANVTVVDQAADKRDLALDLGAHHAVIAAELDGRFDAIIDFVSAEATLRTAVEHVNRRGIVVAIGLYGGRIPFGVGAVPHEAQFMSSIWGTVPELGQLVDFAQNNEIQYTVEALRLEDAEIAHQRLRSGQVDGRLVLVPSLS
ncbi:MAG: alcohol dehydrogenase catalytic domain-containing protein [Actinobacteria bacterium]|nr:alcohol dehydrogenase catalytic domain-containing protein [Actinomycetota bacterium]